MAPKSVPRRPLRYQLPLQEVDADFDPALAILDFAPGVSVDLRAMCLLQRGTDTVETGIYLKSRIRALIKLVEIASQKIISGEATFLTAGQGVRSFSLYLRECDDKYGYDVLTSIESSSMSLDAYIRAVNERVTNSELSARSASIYKRYAIEWTGLIIGTSENLKRKTERYKLPLTELPEGFRVEDAVLDFGTSGSVDIGALCFIGDDLGLAELRFVVADRAPTACPSRIHAMVKVVTLVSAKITSGERTIQTAFVELTTFCAFLRENDELHKFDVLQDETSAREALTQYCRRLDEQAAEGTISDRTSQTYKRTIANFIENIVDGEWSPRRKSQDYLLPLITALPNNLRPEIVRMVFASGQAIDLGAMCYLRGERKVSGREGQAAVELDSFSETRAKAMTRLLIEVSEKLRLGEWRDKTAHRSVSDFFIYLRAADSRCAYDVLQNEETSRESLNAYTHGLNTQIYLGQLSNNTAATYQRAAIEWTERLLDAPLVGKGIQIIKKRHDSTVSTPPPSEEWQGKQGALSEALFHGLADFVMSKGTFPLRLNVPAYLEEPGNCLWVFPTPGFFQTSSERAKADKEPQKRGGWPLNFETGEFRPVDEIAHHYGLRSSAKLAISRAKKTLSASNHNVRHQARLELGLIALSAAMDLFMAISGGNLQPVTDMEWDSGYVISPTSQGYRSLKARAGGKEVEFRMTTAFLPSFRKMQKLRSWLLGDAQFRYFFFAAKAGQDGTIKPKQIDSSWVGLYYQKRIDPTLEILRSRDWRAAKGNHVTDKHGIEAASTALSNDVRTSERSYSGGTPTQTIREFGGYFQQLHAIVLSARKEADRFTKSSVGGCRKPGEPEAITEAPPVAPDCDQPEGCLFCKKQILVADEVDIRKLSSCRFCIISSKTLSDSAEAWRKLFSGVIARIDSLLEQIASVSNEHAQLVARVVNEVESTGALDPYWLKKLELLIELGALA